MSIFLLVSIGSICAENVTADADLQSTDDESVDMIAEETSDPGVVATQDKINTTVETDQKEYKFSEDDDKNISLEVKDNESQALTISEGNLTVSEGTKSLNFTYNNSKIALTDNFAVGAHNITINYLGDSNYNSSSTNILLKIFGEKSLELNDTIVINGNDIEIPVKVFDGVDYLNVTKEDFGSLTLTYTNATGNRTSEEINNFNVEDGKIKFNFQDLNKLIAATITVNYTNGTNINGTTSIKFATRVNASDVKIHENADKNITVSILFNDKNLTIAKNDLKVLENGKDIAFEYNNSIIKITSLAKGVHTLTIVYKGNETYYTSNKTITVKVWGNQSFNPDKTANLDSDNNVNITLNLSDGADPVNVTVANVNLTLVYKVGNATYNKTISGISLLDDKQTIRFNVEDISFDTAYINIKYVAETNLTATTTLKVGTNISIPNSMNEAGGKVINFTVTVQSVNGTVINVTVNNTKIYKDGKEVKFAYNNSVAILSDTFTFGVYNITVKYLGTDTYSEVAKSFILAVYGINTTSKKDMNSTLKGEIKLNIVNGAETVNITADDLTLNLTYKNGNDTITIPIKSKVIKNGTLIFTVENGNFTSSILNIKYNNTEVNVTIDRKYNIKVEAINNVVEYQSGKLTYKIIDIDTNEGIANKTVNLEYKITTSSISISGVSGSGITIISTISNTTNENGIVTFDNNKMNPQGWGFMEVGNHTVTIKSNAFNKTNGTSQNIIIDKANIKIVIDPFKEYWGTSKKVKITVTNAKSGNPVAGTILKLYLPKTSGVNYYVQTNSDGIGEIGVSGLVSGDYELTVSNNDTKNINGKSAKTTVSILKKPIQINVQVGTMYYNTGSTATVKITDKATGKALAGVYFLVQFDKNSEKTYLFQTNNKGQISFSDSLDVGKHTIVVAGADTRYDGKTVTKSFTVKKASAKIKAPKVTDYYKGVKYFTVKLVNSKNNKIIYAAKLNIKVYVTKNKYYNYNGKTGANGQIRLLLDSLKPGKYKVEVSGDDNKNFAAKMVTSKIVIKKAPTKLTPKKLTAKKGAKKYFQVKVTNKKTKKVIKGVKVKIKVYTGKKAKTYKAKTNAKGIAKILTNKLKVGKHKVIVTSANKYCVAKKAKSTIKIKK